MKAPVYVEVGDINELMRRVKEDRMGFCGLVPLDPDNLRMGFRVIPDPPPGSTYLESSEQVDCILEASAAFNKVAD